MGVQWCVAALIHKWKRMNRSIPESLLTYSIRKVIIERPIKLDVQSYCPFFVLPISLCSISGEFFTFPFPSFLGVLWLIYPGWLAVRARCDGWRGSGILTGIHCRFVAPFLAWPFGRLFQCTSPAWEKGWQNIIIHLQTPRPNRRRERESWNTVGRG